MGIIGKTLITGAKVVGTMVAGTAGLAAGMVEVGVGAVSPELSEGFGSLRKGCFGAVGSMWNSDKDLGDTLDSLGDAASKFMDKIEGCSDELEKWSYDKRKEIIENPEKLKGILEKKGMDPKLAYNPSFIKALKDKYLN